MKRFGVGVIGCGAISGNHFHAIGKTDNAALRAVCDIDEAKLQKAMAAQRADGYYNVWADGSYAAYGYLWSTCRLLQNGNEFVILEFYICD